MCGSVIKTQRTETETRERSSAASDVYKRQVGDGSVHVDLSRPDLGQVLERLTPRHVVHENHPLCAAVVPAIEKEKEKKKKGQS